MKKIVVTPEEILPAGDDEAVVVNPFTGIAAKARKGTVAATLNNIALLERILKNGDFSEIVQIREAVTKLIPSLKVVGVFDLFNLEEWINDPNRLGRIYVVALYLKTYPEEMNEELISKLKAIQATTPSIPLKSLLEEILKIDKG